MVALRKRKAPAKGADSTSPKKEPAASVSPKKDSTVRRAASARVTKTSATPSKATKEAAANAGAAAKGAPATKSKGTKGTAANKGEVTPARVTKAAALGTPARRSAAAVRGHSTKGAAREYNSDESDADDTKASETAMAVPESDSEDETDNGSEQSSDSEEDRFAAAADAVSLDAKTQKAVEERLKAIPQNLDGSKRGVMYIGHIPHGFYEDQIRGFFSQFGDVTRVRVSRSKKSGKPKGYAFVEFKYREVAEIAADTMNNYLMFNRLLKCKMVDEDSVHPELFKGADKKFKRVPWQRVERLRRQKAREDPKQHQRVVGNLLKAETKKRKRIEALGIDYEFPGYSATALPAPKKKRFDD